MIFSQPDWITAREGRARDVLDAVHHLLAGHRWPAVARRRGGFRTAPPQVFALCRRSMPLLQALPACARSLASYQRSSHKCDHHADLLRPAKPPVGLQSPPRQIVDGEPRDSEGEAVGRDVAIIGRSGSRNHSLSPQNTRSATNVTAMSWSTSSTCPATTLAARCLNSGCPTWCASSARYPPTGEQRRGDQAGAPGPTASAPTPPGAPEGELLRIAVSSTIGTPSSYSSRPPSICARESCRKPFVAGIRPLPPAPAGRSRRQRSRTAARARSARPSPDPQSRPRRPGNHAQSRGEQADRHQGRA